MVTFTNICAACEPIQIVNMLNSMYSKFDRLTSVHDVYKVSVCVLQGGRLWSQQAGPQSQAFLFTGLVFDVDESRVRRKSSKGIGSIL